MHIAIIGGGAAGCFAAVNVKRLHPEAEVTVYEAATKPLVKVSITGGGRCNLTNSFQEVRSMEQVYPRGHRLMKRLLKEFGNIDVCRWFEDAGVRLVTQPDQCVFPVSQDAMEIVNVLLSLIKHEKVNVRTGCRVSKIEDKATDTERYRISFATDAEGRTTPDIDADIVIVTTGGNPKRGGYSMLDGLDLEIIDPLPSLFSFNIGSPDCIGNPALQTRDRELSALMGTVVNGAVAGLAGTKFRAEGPLLITDWGVSGPAILKLSSYAARYLAENQYKSRLVVNWLGEMNVNDVLSMLTDFASRNPQKQLSSIYPERFNSRLWSFLLGRAGLPETKRWAELSRKGLNKLADTLTSDLYPVTGRNRFKGEFVTCGGVALSEIDQKTLESRKHPGLYFAGEVLDVDAITGGFNLQAAWTMGYIVANSVSRP